MTLTLSNAQEQIFELTHGSPWLEVLSKNYQTLADCDIAVIASHSSCFSCLVLSSLKTIDQ